MSLIGNSKQQDELCLSVAFIGIPNIRKLSAPLLISSIPMSPFLSDSWIYSILISCKKYVSKSEAKTMRFYISLLFFQGISPQKVYLRASLVSQFHRPILSNKWPNNIRYSWLKWIIWNLEALYYYFLKNFPSPPIFVVSRTNVIFFC